MKCSGGSECRAVKCTLDQFEVYSNSKQLIKALTSIVKLSDGTCRLMKGEELFIAEQVI